MIEMIKRFEQIRNLNESISTLMALCMTVYGAGYSKEDIEEAMKLVDRSDYKIADKDAIVAALVNLTKKKVKKGAK